MRKTAYIGWNNDISQFWGILKDIRGGDVILKMQFVIVLI